MCSSCVLQATQTHARLFTVVRQTIQISHLWQSIKKHKQTMLYMTQYNTVENIILLDVR